MGDESSLSLGGVIELLGEALVDAVHHGSDRWTDAVRGVVVYDAVAPPELKPGDLVLAVGINPSTSEMRALLVAATDGACLGLVCKVASQDQHEFLAEEAARRGLAVVVLAYEPQWEEMISLLRAAAIASGVALDSDLGSAAGDLAAFADAAAAMLEAPVIIDDDRFAVIAFSSLDDPIDEERRQSILQRRVPGELVHWLHESGIADQIRRTRGTVAYAVPTGGARLGIAVRSGSEIVGYLWVSEGVRSFDARTAELVAAIAEVAALHILRARISGGIRTRLRSNILRRALSGLGSSAALAGALEVSPGDAFRVVAFQVTQRQGQELLMAAVQDLVALHVAALADRGAVAGRAGVVYALVHETGTDGVERAVRLAEETIGRSRSRLGTVIRAVVGPRMVGFDELAETRLDLDRVLDLPTTGPVVLFDDMASQTVLTELTELLTQRAALRRGGVAVLVRLDAERGSDYMKSLRAYFDANCELGVAARSLYLHRNTLKYRIGRIKDLCGLDLEDPVQRLVAELQTRAHFAGRRI